MARVEKTESACSSTGVHWPCIEHRCICTRGLSVTSFHSTNNTFFLFVVVVFFFHSLLLVHMFAIAVLVIGYFTVSLLFFFFIFFLFTLCLCRLHALVCECVLGFCLFVCLFIEQVTR